MQCASIGRKTGTGRAQHGLATRNYETEDTGYDTESQTQRFANQYREKIILRTKKAPGTPAPRRLQPIAVVTVTRRRRTRSKQKERQKRREPEDDLKELKLQEEPNNQNGCEDKKIKQMFHASPLLAGIINYQEEGKFLHWALYDQVTDNAL